MPVLRTHVRALGLAWHPRRPPFLETPLVALPSVLAKSFDADLSPLLGAGCLPPLPYVVSLLRPQLSAQNTLANLEVLSVFAHVISLGRASVLVQRLKIYHYSTQIHILYVTFHNSRFIRSYNLSSVTKQCTNWFQRQCCHPFFSIPWTVTSNPFLWSPAAFVATHW